MASPTTAWPLLAAIVLGTAFFPATSGEFPRYVGSETCGECHGEQYETYTRYAKKAHSYDSILVMKKGLTPDEFEDCLECHVTGYGRPGGFLSAAETPHLKDAGCEVCHGPGSVHVESFDAADIKGDLSVEDCQRCHNEERVNSFDYKPLLFGGAH